MPAAPRRHAAEDVAAADHDGDLHAQPHDLADLGDDAVDHLAVDAVGVFAHQRLARQLEQDALVHRLRAPRSDAGSVATLEGAVIGAVMAVRSA